MNDTLVDTVMIDDGRDTLLTIETSGNSVEFCVETENGEYVAPSLFANKENIQEIMRLLQFWLDNQE